MSKCASIKMKKRFIAELEDLRELDRKNQEKIHAYARLKQIRDEEEELDKNVDKFNAELTEFKKYIQEESFKVEDHLEVISEYENSINEDKMKQQEYNNKIKLIDASIGELKEVIRLTKTHIEYYRPYEKCISDVIAQNPQYNDVFHIIEHVEELANIRSLGSKLVISDSDDDKQKNNTLSEMFHDGEKQKDHVILKTDFNDVRTYFKDLKEADLMYIKKQLNVELNSEDNVKFNQVNPVYLQTDVDKIVNKRKQLETDIPKQQIHKKIDEKLEVIRLISHQYREIYLRYNDKLPPFLPSTEDQLMYFSKFLKKSMKRLEIHKDVILGKMRIKEYVLKEKKP